MKAPSPIKRHHAIVSLSKDHHFALLLVWKIRQGLVNTVSTERISDYVLYFFREALEVHFREEEQLLFCRLPANDDLRLQAEKDHQYLRSLVADISLSQHETALLISFADGLEKHIRFEERELFNHLQEKLTANELEEIEKLLSGSKTHDEKWDDNFWETSKRA